MIKIKIGPEHDTEFKYKLNIRKTIGGDYIVYDHPDVDIMIMPQKRKVVILTNDSLNSSSKTYETQNQIMKFLRKKGVVKPETIHSGNVYSSLEAQYDELNPPKEGVSATDLVIKTIAEWVQQEKPNWLYQKELKEKEVESFTNPDDDTTTPLGRVDHQDKKGYGGDLGTFGTNWGR